VQGKDNAGLKLVKKHWGCILSKNTENQPSTLGRRPLGVSHTGNQATTSAHTGQHAVRTQKNQIPHHHGLVQQQQQQEQQRQHQICGQNASAFAHLGSISNFEGESLYGSTCNIIIF